MTSESLEGGGMKPTRWEEHAALLERAARVPVHHMPDAPEFMRATGNADAVDWLRRTGAKPVEPDADPCVFVCSIYRTRKRFPDNTVTRCADCREEVEHR